MEKSIIIADQKNRDPYSKDANNRGLVPKEHFLASSGFRYMVGARDCHYFRIEEAVSDGVGVSYLCGLKVFIEEELIIDESYRNVMYTRNDVRDMVGGKLLKYFSDAMYRQGVNINENALRQKIDTLLDNAYYAKSDEAAIGLMGHWGLME